ncbi:MAG: AAA family ATPase [Gammaproteobacteria bacterium]|nr:AAA family ATPase [Gammaproteobacteria bacterium]MCF6260181.1 AAA family ATPase [Gammaproteobacteria bacterium]
MSVFRLNFSGFDDQNIEQSIESGHIMFLVGENGTGKSTLMHKFATQNTNRVRRITAHRQVWLSSNTIDITPTAREQTQQNINNRDQQTDSRWKDDHAAQRAQVTIFDLVDVENIDARKIAEAARSGEMNLVKYLASIQSPMSNMNDILKISNLDIKIRVDEGSKLIAERGDLPGYSIAELSDGERNALLIIANVLTAPSDTLILLDEPERHLHRSIVSPLLSTLLAYREDCAFVIFTHDVSLPMDQLNASCLLVRSYSHDPQQWETDYIESVEELDNEIAIALLGSRRSILFIEGDPSSLDIQIYQILYPNVSVKPVGSCIVVERIVKGLRSSEENHWVSAYGIIDRDNRSDEDCKRLESNGVIALKEYSVESLCYHPAVIEIMILRVSDINGINSSEAFSKIISGVLSSIVEHKDRMISRLVERRIKDKLLYDAPNWKEILNGKTNISISADEILAKEAKLIEEFIGEEDVGSLISRYPVRETPALECVSQSLGYQSQSNYEQAVRKMLSDSEKDRKILRNIISPVSDLLSTDVEQFDAAIVEH